MWLSSAAIQTVSAHSARCPVLKDQKTQLKVSPEIPENPTQYPSKILTKTFISIQFQYAMNERPLPTTQTPIIACPSKIG
jgi:hypothetical protein